MVLHLLQVGKSDLDGERDIALGQALAGRDDKFGDSGVVGRRLAELEGVAVADYAFLAGVVGDVEVAAGYESVWAAVAEQAGDAAGARVGGLACCVLLGLTVFECELALYFVGDGLLDFWRERGTWADWSATGAGRQWEPQSAVRRRPRPSLLIGGVRGLEILRNHVVG